MTALQPSQSQSHETGGADVAVASFASGGDKVGTVPVHISYGIIERFSEGLYSSPNKTFEELITNSYDAGASQVWVYLPSDFSAGDAKLLVVDDGTSMDQDGLENLWRIGESRKRAEGPADGKRKPVGKFGIGKLATYVLGNELTYVAHQGDEYLAVTMDYARIAHNEGLLDGTDLALDVVKHTKESAMAAIRDSLQGSPVAETAEVLDRLEGLDHWTVAVLSNLKPAAREIKLGRLRWVLRSALPLNPRFALFLNDEPVLSSKIDGDVSWSFTVGLDDHELARNAEREWGPAEQIKIPIDDANSNATAAKEGTPTTVPAVRLPYAGQLTGAATLYKQPLERGRSEELGRSHGFFVRVRGRLINIDNEDFSVGPELRHGTLTRFRMEINADDLDDQVASARESLKESKALQELKNYLLAVFNKARSVLSEEDSSDVMANISRSGRLAQPSAALSQGPLRRMLQRAVAGDATVSAALGMDESQSSSAADVLATGGNVIDKVLLEAIDSEKPIVFLDPARKAAVLNQAHPFINNYISSKSVAEPLKLLGLSELLMQAYLLDENVPADLVARVMKRRDVFLRELTYRFPRSASVIAQSLRDATNDENALEDAVGDALELLGYDVQRLGGPTHGTDGIATARLGRRGDGTSETYAFTYDAKSTKDSVKASLTDSGQKTATPSPGKIRADTARTSVLKVHRQRAAETHSLDVVPSFTLLVAPDFQGALSEDGLINDVCVNDEITAIRVEDLARLVELFTLQGLNPNDLRPLFDARTPEQTHRWVDEQSDKVRVPAPPVSDLVDELVKNSGRKFPLSYETLAAYLSTRGHDDVSVPEVESLVRGLAALAPRSVYNDDRIVALNATPAALYQELRESLDSFDQDLVGEYLGTVPKEESSK